VPNWKSLLVGETARDINYYRDLFLLWPFLLFTIAGLVEVFSPTHAQRIDGLKFLALGAATIALARERFILFLGALGFCAVRLPFALLKSHDTPTLVAVLGTGLLLVLALRLGRNYKPSYEWPKDLHILDLVIGLSSLALTLFAFTHIGH
jgi:cell division protein FtsW (lipid II flippase)